MSAELEARVMELETRVAFQDDTLAELNEVLVEQSREVDHLRRQMAELIKRFNDVAGQMPGATAEDAPPPHY